MDTKTQLAVVRLEGLRTHMEIVTKHFSGCEVDPIWAWALRQLEAGITEANFAIEETKKEAAELAAAE